MPFTPTLPTPGTPDVWGATMNTAINGLAAAHNALEGRGVWLHARTWGINGLVTDEYTTQLNTAVSEIATAGGGFLYLPRGIYTTSGINLRTGVTLVGDGWFATEIRYSPASNGEAVVRMVPSPDGVAPGTFYSGVRDLFINGNYWDQTGGTGHGIKAVANPLWSKGSGDPAFDTQHVFENVLIRYTRGDGFFADGRGEHFLRNVVVRDGRANGLTPTADTHMVTCVAGGNLGHGFNLVQASGRLVGCKAFYSGYEWTGVDTWTNHAGFNLQGTSGGQYVLAGCEAQDNGGPGFSLTTSPNNNIQGTADSNCRFSNTLPAVDLSDSRGNIIDVTCLDRYSPTTQKSAFRARNNSVGNLVRLSNRGHLAALGSTMASGHVTGGNDITVMTVSGTSYTVTRETAA